MKYQYPHCPTVDTVEDWFGTKLPDPYAWLRDRNDPKVLDFVARENAYTDAFFPQEDLEAMKADLKANALPGLPGSITPWGEKYLGTVMTEGDYYLKVLDNQLSVIGDLPKMESLGNVLVFRAQACPRDEDILAMMIQYPGAARPSLAVCRHSTGEVLTVIHSLFSYCWSCGDGCLYYSSTQSNAETQESHSVFFRYDPVSGCQTTVYEDNSFSIFGQVSASRDGRYVMAEVCKDYAFARWVAIETETGAATVLTDSVVEWKYMDSVDGKHYFITLSEAANGAVIAVTETERATVLPESRRILSEGFSVGGQLFVLAMDDVSSRLIRVSDQSDVALPSNFGALEIAGEANDGLFLHFESFLDAPRILHFDGCRLTAMALSSQQTWPELTVEQGFAPSAQDSTPIPYYLVRRADAEKNGVTPTFIHAYGGYNVGLTPQYSERISGLQIARWVQDGGIYVQCNLRGGSEYGPRWHEDGMMLNKRHCYEDFIGVAEELLRLGWTKPEKLAICGCSNGGLLMSALVTMRPDLWGCVLDSVPHTDMIHFVEDDRGPMYITEYGNPRADKEMFEYLLSYSPYHNVKEVAYPPVYIQTGELDNNVPPYHGKKFAARMQALNRSDNPILLRVLAEGSHDRGRGEAYWQTIAEMQLFLKYAMNR